MRKEPNVRLEQRRIAGPANTNCGMFRYGPLAFIVSDGGGWDHVSVSCHKRLPTWDEMDLIKQLVFRDEEIVMQLHVNDSRKVNDCRYCLHMWRPQTVEEMHAIKVQWEARGDRWPEEWQRAPEPLSLPPRSMV